MANKFKYLVIHCTDSPYNREITPDDIYGWHIGKKKNSDGTYTYMGRIYNIEQLRKMTFKYPSGKTISVSATNGRGWKQVGYSDLIQRSGKLINLVPYNGDAIIDSFEITNGAAGYNSVSRHVVLAGGWTYDDKIKNGMDPNTKRYFTPNVLYTKDQLETLRLYIDIQLQIAPHLIIVGHNQLAPKTCPNFDVNKYLISIGKL